METSSLSSTQIDRIVERAIKFLSAASQLPAIRARLDAGGYNEEEHRTGWNRTLELLGYRAQPDVAVPSAQLRQQQATAELDQWDGPAFDRARAALERRFPAQAAYVFRGLTAKTGAEAIGSVRTFLDRVAALRDGSDPQRTSTREADAQAAALLATRRIVDDREEARLRALIEDATSLADLPTLAEPDPSQRQSAARALDDWLRDWRGTARVLITRRDHQIRLGLAERRSAKATEPDPGAGDLDATES
jgi:hypothetical protein